MPKTKKSQALIEFKPKIIISSILMISSAFYIINIIFTIFFNSFFGIRLHISQIISDKALDFSSSYGSAYLCSLFFTYVFMIGANNRTANSTGKITLQSGRDTSAIEYSADIHPDDRYQRHDPLEQ